MLKKIIAMMIVFAMLVPVSSAVAADNDPVMPTIEEILNEYHEKAFRERQAEDNGAATYARRGGKTLEEETVDELTAAGYEAYNVTGENYETLEATLQTDFSQLGIDPEGSYIVVISGEEPPSPGNSSRAGDPLLPPHTEDEEDGSGGNYFNYTYGNQTYRMRYITFTSANDAGMRVDSIYTLSASAWQGQLEEMVFETALFSMADAALDKLPLGTIFSLIFGAMDNPNYFEIGNNTLTIHANTTWTGSCIQIFDSFYSRWESRQCSVYAVSKAKIVGYLYNASTNETTWYGGSESTTRHYSPKYSNYSLRKMEAATAYAVGNVAKDCTGDIDFFLENDALGISYRPGDDPLFTHQEGWYPPNDEYIYD